MITHVLKIYPAYFDAVASGRKTVELRNGDRDYATGDTLVLREWTPVYGHTGRECRVIVTHITRGEEWLQPGVVALSIRTQASVDRVAALERLHNACRLREQALDYLVRTHGTPENDEKKLLMHDQLQESHGKISEALDDLARMEVNAT